MTWYSGNNLKIDGYFHYDSDGRSEIYLLYRNGVILYGGAPLLGDVGARESEFQNGSYYSHVNESKTAWGRFIINDSNIKYEKWNTSTGGPLETFIASGAILNDTTFRITAVDHSNGDHYDADKVFMYKKFSPKPDSTNTYTD